MEPLLKIVYWKGEQFWLGKFIDHAEIMSQGETLPELEENLRDAYRELRLEDVRQSANGAKTTGSAVTVKSMKRLQDTSKNSWG